MCDFWWNESYLKTKMTYINKNISFELPLDLGYISRGGHQKVSFMHRIGLEVLIFLNGLHGLKKVRADSLDGASHGSPAIIKLPII